MIDQAGGEAENTYFACVFPNDPVSSSERYHKAYGTNSPQLAYVEMGIDGMKKLKEALSQSRASSRPLLESFQQTFGPTRSANRVERIYQVRNGKSVELDFGDLRE